MSQGHVINKKYKSVVIGAGPAGIACIGNLLDCNTCNLDKILWIDPEFHSGRLVYYPAVPSNTKVALFSKFATECAAFRSIAEESKTLKHLDQDLDQNRGCSLNFASELCKELTDGLLKNERKRLDIHCGSVKTLKYSSNQWKVFLEENKSSDNLYYEIITENVFLCTGSRPREYRSSENTKKPSCNTIPLDTALNPTLLSTRIQSGDKIAVFGSSHSAMLVLMNLLENNTEFKGEIHNFYRHPLKFAQFPDPINKPDVILHDNTGLKGDVAEWVRQWSSSTCDENVYFGGKLKRIQTLVEPSIDDFDKVIFAIGYERNPLPTIHYEDQIISAESIDYSPNGQILANSHLSLNGMYGFGIAFPERVKDLDGSDESAVGLWKFMKHIKRSISGLKF